MAVAAFFDVDGTLIAKNSGPLYMKFLRQRGEIRRRDALRTLYFYLRYRLNLLDIERAVERSIARSGHFGELSLTSHGSRRHLRT